MKNLGIGLATFAASLGVWLAAGCSEAESPAVADASVAAADGGTTPDATAPPDVDASPSAPACVYTEPDAGPGTACPSPAPAQIVPYRPAARTASCTPDDVAFLETQVRESTATATLASLRDALATRSPTCAACAFTRECDAAWGPVVFSNEARTRGFVNFAGCAERAPGGSKACAEALHANQRCLDVVCPPSACGASSECARDATKPGGACASSVAATCGESIPSLCENIFGAVRVLCGANADGGS